MPYVIGIDLGTTNSAAAYVDLSDPLRAVTPFPVPQLVSEGNIAERPSLPSFLYLGGERDVAPGSLALPWDPSRTFAVGEFARLQGARVPGRLISSAKSWLCHGGVDREAPILPWAGAEDVKKISPVEASSRYLAHLREAWALRFPDAPLEDQDIVLTVPASFDEVARELTVEAAQAAGLQKIVLLEEPQAAFYAWIHANQQDWEKRLADVRLVLVIDIGGGTTDFTLVAVRHDGTHTELDRRAVGDHLLLGGDNIDVALARGLEPRLGVKLDSQRWHALTSLCRTAKETLLGSAPPSDYAVRLTGRGRAVVGGTLSASLARSEVEQLVMEGFFPACPPDALPRKAARTGLQEWGLPFANEPEVPRHLAAFLRQHAGDETGASLAPQEGHLARPDAVLFNGGALKPALIRNRLLALLAEWDGGRVPALLESPDLDVAVARGAAYYGLVRRGLGVRIGGGSPRSYYVGLAGTAGTSPELADVLCVVHRGMHEGDEIEVRDPEFSVTTNRPVSFPLYSSSTRLGDGSGAVIRAERDSLTELPPIRTVLRFGKKMEARTIPVHVLAKLTEIGTLEIWCRSLQTDHRWRLQFGLRDRPSAQEAAAERREVALEVGPERLDAAAAAIRNVFPPTVTNGGDPVGLVRVLEDALGAGKDAWPLDLIRKLWDVLLEGRAARAAGAQHEARWLNLCGFLLRPGFGHELDEWRVTQLWKLSTEGLRFPRAVQSRVEWWNMWKRVAGGLSRPQQLELYNQTAPMLVPRLKSRLKDRKSAAGPQEIREYWQLLASCERLDAKQKGELGGLLLATVLKGKATEPEIWALGRLGARAPFAGPLNCVVERRTVEEWVEKLLQCEWARPEATAFACMQLARCVGDRERDLDEALRGRLADRLRSLPAGRRAARLVTEVVPLETQERARILDESLPVGLAVREDATPTR